MKTLQTILVLMFTVLLAGCSSSPASNPAALAQLGQLTTKQDGKIATTMGVAGSASFEQLQSASKKIGNALTTASKKMLDPNSPEALDREEKIARGEIEEETGIQSASSLQENPLHMANIDSCTAQPTATGMTLSVIPMGISECEMVSLRGKPTTVRKLSLPNEQRRILLSFNSKDGEMLYEFVDNKLVTIY